MSEKQPKLIDLQDEKQNKKVKVNSFFLSFLGVGKQNYAVVFQQNIGETG